MCLLSALFSDSDTCAIAMKDSETEKNCNEKKPCTKLPVRKDEREVKWQKGEIVFSFLQISPMVIINQVQ